MAELRRSDVPGKKAGPHGSFPVGDKKHARLAIGGATRSEEAGNISREEEGHIKAEARQELGEHEKEHNRKLGTKLRHGREGDNETRHGTGGGFFGHPHGHSPANVMPHPAGDGHIVMHTHGGFSHHHSDGSVTHHSHTGEFLAAEGGEGRHLAHHAMNAPGYQGHFQTGVGHEAQGHQALSYPRPGVGPNQFPWR